MIKRLLETEIRHLAERLPVVGIVGPRQVGKTTLAKKVVNLLPKETVYLDLELPSDLNKLRDPELFLKRNEDKTVILDEVQRMPEIFPVIRALVDQKREPGRFIILGSASPVLLRQSSESLAGRIIYLEMQPVFKKEIPETDFHTHWLRGGYPDALLAPADDDAFLWLRGFVQSYIERDLNLLGMNAEPARVRQLLTMLTTVHGNLLNYSLLAKSLAMSVTAVMNYIDFLEQAFLIRRLSPFYQNIKKRLVKAPKLYIRDNGVLHHLAGISNINQLQGHILAGHSWEGYVLQQVAASLPPDVYPYFYRTQDGSEVDLVLTKGDTPLVAIEIKLTNSPSLSRGNTLALQDLGVENCLVITPSADVYPLREGVTVCSVDTFNEVLVGLGIW